MLERERDLAALVDVLDDARSGTGRIAVIEGPAGIGKSMLLDAACRAARDGDMRVLGARAGEIEQGIAFGVTRQLLERVLARASSAERADLLAGAAGLAGRVFAAEAEPYRPDDDLAEQTMHGLYWLTSNLATGDGLVLAVDDAQWADAASMRFLGYLARRIDDLPVAVLVTARGTGTDGLLADLVAHPQTVVVRPAPLSIRGVGALLDQPADGAVVAACRDVTGGIPLLVATLADELRASGTAPDPAAIAELDLVATGPLLSRRLAGLDPVAVAICRAIAVLGSSAIARRVATLAETDLDSTLRALASLETAGLVARGRPVRFSHPLVRSAIYDALSRTELDRLHRRAADLLAGEHADPAEVGVHLAAIEPANDPAVVAGLVDAAASASARGAVESAIGFLTRALEEPPAEGQVRGILLDLGRLEAHIQAPSAVGHLMAVLDTGDVDDPLAVSAASLLVRGAIFVGEMGHAVAIADRFTGASEAARSRIDRELLLAAQVSVAGRRAVLPRLERVCDAALEDPAAVDRHNLAHAAFELAVSRTNRHADAVRLADLALDGGRLLDELGPDVPLVFVAINARVLSDRIDEAAALLAKAADAARRAGSTRGYAMASCWQANCSLVMGDLREAEASAQSALDLAAGALSVLEPMVLRVLVACLLETGRTGEARRILDRYDGMEADDVFAVAYWRLARAQVLRAEGALDESLEELRRIGAFQRAWPTYSQIALPWHLDAVEVLTSLNSVEEARHLAEEHLDLARTSGLPTALGGALRVTAGTAPDPQQRLALLRESATVMERSASRLERARALTALGAELARQEARDEARDVLLRALEAAHLCGASVIRDTAQQALRGLGVRPRRVVAGGVAALTAAELRVAQLAAEGRTNREIAQHAFLSLKTVEMHLTRVYRKLGIDSRDGIAAVLDADASAVA